MLTPEAVKATVKKYASMAAIIAIAFVVGFLVGFCVRAKTHHCPGPVMVQGAPEEVTVQHQKETVIRYVPKTSPKDADVDISIPKRELTVKVNGQTQKFEKTDSEKYVLDKNKISLEQSSKASVDIKVPVIDETRKWELGVGVDKHGQPDGMIGFPVKGHVGGWIAGSKNAVMGGVKVNF